MEQTTLTLLDELQAFRTKVKHLISRLYRENVRNPNGDVRPEAALAEEWEYEGLEFNAITEEGLAYITDNKINELFTWDDLETESLIEVVHMLEGKEFVDS